MPKPNREKTPCSICNGTGTQLIHMGKYTYGRECRHEFDQQMSFAGAINTLLKQPVSPQHNGLVKLERGYK